MDKNTPLSLPLPDHEMDSNGKPKARNKIELISAEPPVELIKNIKSYSRALHVKPSKSVVKLVEYVTN